MEAFQKTVNELISQGIIDAERAIQANPEITKLKFGRNNFFNKLKI